MRLVASITSLGEGTDMEVWVERELRGCEFSDQRLKLRLGKVLDKLGQTIGATLPPPARTGLRPKPLTGSSATRE